MIPGITGTLLSVDALVRVIPDALRGRLDEQGRDAARTQLRAWHEPVRRHLGPAVSARGLYDRLGGPLMARLGYRVVPTASECQTLRAVLDVDGRRAAALLVTSWGEDLSTAWREAIRHGIAFEARWCLCLSGQFLRVVDTRRTYSRRYVEFDLHVAFDDPRPFAVLWGLLRAPAMAEHGDPLLDIAVTLSEQHRTAVRESLQSGVHDALTHLSGAFRRARAARSRGRVRVSPLHDVASTDESLVVVYRILFLLFAEARGLVPRWHPVYRDGYTIEALRGPVETLPRPRGLWEALQAITRLAHRGCHAGSLRVPPFNGRLFSPAHAPLADTLPLDDGAVRRAVLALTTRPGSAGRERISYADLSVEQLGGVYERLLDFETGKAAGQTGTANRSHRRKSTGTFYTPRSLAEYLVRRTLAPLVQSATPDAILALRVLDPAMGSGAFLVAACRYLAGAYEMALLRDGGISSSDISEADRAGFRRVVAQRCLFGVDINPMAVQLARLSLWLATLATDRPLTFLDHHLRTGNSLVGASFADLARQPPPGRGGVRARRMPLFGGMPDVSIGTAVGVRQAIATEPGDTLDQVRAKERALGGLQDAGAPLQKWTRALDLWCSGWFQPGDARAVIRTAFPALVDEILTARRTLTAGLANRLMDEARANAADHRFFHWEIEFPEVFRSVDGAPLPSSGFDALIGNPPWEMLRGDLGDPTRRDEARRAAAQLSDFARSSGVYALQGDGHANLYQLFLERALTLVHAGGRLGLVLPSGFALDHGCAALRRAVFDHAQVDTLIGIENRDRIFPIHRGLKFLVMAATRGRPTTVLPCRFGVRRTDVLEQLPDIGNDPAVIPVATSLLDRLSGPELAIPELRTARDLEIATEIALRVPPLEDVSGWHVRFGRELNATEDRCHFTDGPGLPVIEGKHVQPFEVRTSTARFRVAPAVAGRLLAAPRAGRRARLAYRDVASATNRLTLIAAIVPADVLTTHTLFCLKDDVDEDAQHVLCGLFNSYVANYLVRLRVGTHVTTAIIGRLPVPRPVRDSREFAEMCALSRALHRTPGDPDAAARQQALAATLYGLSRDQLQHVLNTFPLVPQAEREAVMSVFAI